MCICVCCMCVVCVMYDIVHIIINFLYFFAFIDPLFEELSTLTD